MNSTVRITRRVPTTETILRPTVEPSHERVPLLEARELSLRGGVRPGGHRASLALHAGEIHAIVGPGGAGKSTLMRRLAGELTAGVATATGSLRLRGEDVTHWSAQRLARAGIARSDPRDDPRGAPGTCAGAGPGTLTLLEQCRRAAQATQTRRWVPWAWSAQRRACAKLAERALARVGLGASSGGHAADLSPGQQRRLDIARCLAIDPLVLLLDEPLAGVDASEAAQLAALLRELRDSHAILLSSQDLEAVAALADRVTVLVDGTVVASGTPAEVRANADVQAAGLGGHCVDAASSG